MPLYLLFYFLQNCGKPLVYNSLNIFLVSSKKCNFVAMWLQGLFSILLLIASNVFMTLAWYLHLQGQRFTFLQKMGLFSLIVFSWGLAFFEYVLQVPANRLGHKDHGGPFGLFELKMIQEIITLTVFSLITIFVFKTDKFTWNYGAGFLCLLLAVFFVFKKW